jgi:hypothetical protein
LEIDEYEEYEEIEHFETSGTSVKSELGFSTQRFERIR